MGRGASSAPSRHRRVTTTRGGAAGGQKAAALGGEVEPGRGYSVTLCRELADAIGRLGFAESKEGE